MEILGTFLFSLVILLFGLANYKVTFQVIYIWCYEEGKLLNLNSLGQGILFFYQLFYFLAMISYLRGSFSDPGEIPDRIPMPSSKEFPEKLLKTCKKCKKEKFKPPRAHHCKTCKKCIFRMDHHCEWLNNCVGIRNQKYFILFLVYTFIFCSLVLILTISNAYIYWQTATQKKQWLILTEINVSKGVFLLIGIFSIFFVFMTVSFLNDQIEAIDENQSTVESHKQQYGRPYTFRVGLEKIFGKNYFTWFLPTRPRVRANYLENLYTDTQLQMMEKSGKIEFMEDSYHLDPFAKWELN